jgi:Outer membrane protein and related peptidoglycan-associated (lipo)proteins
MRIKSSSFVTIFLAATLLQGCSLNSRIKKADATYEKGEYFAAADLYKNVSARIPYTQKELKGRIAFQQGECYRLTNNNRAEQAYINAIRVKYTDTLVYLRYAQVLQRIGKYAEASKNYAIYLKKDSSSILAKNGILACKNVSDWKKIPTRYTVKKADLLNVRMADNFSPAYMGTDAEAIVFTSTRQANKKTLSKNNQITGLPNNNLFVSKKNASGKLEKPELLAEELNATNDDQGACCFSTDGKIMYFTRSRQVVNSQTGTEIMYSNRAGGTWSTPKKLKIFSDSTVSVAHPAIAPDGSTIYFVSDNKNGLGGKDIWRATLDKGECKYIENLGPEINTPGDEMFPTVSANGTLFYSSNGKPGYGGLDLFRATALKDGGWEVANMGEPLNSMGDDFGMTFEGKSEKGFFSSNRGDTKGYDGLFSFELPDLAYVLEGKVTDDKDYPIPDATVKLVSNTGMNARVLTKKDGTYRIKLDKDIDCVMLASARGYLNQQNKLTTQGLTTSKSFGVNFKLSSISKPVQIDNIFYEFGKWDLTPSSTAGLQVLVKILKDNPNITIELSANTDFVGNNEANKILSEKRAKSVVDYLIAAGVAADRLTAVGNGEEKPVVVDASLARKYPYLKENNVLDEVFVTKLTPEQQEVVNQINRRTEFRVLKTTYKLY